MYRRFLNNNDYLGIVTEEALTQLIRGNEERLAQAEEAAEESIVEYLTDNYEVEKCLSVGKNLFPYNSQITYPAGTYFYYNDKIVRTLRPVNGYKAPSLSSFWELCVDAVDTDSVKQYSQLLDYSPGDIVEFGNAFYKCLEYNGYNFNDIHIPGIDAWERVEAPEWLANNEYELWQPVKFNGHYYALIDLEYINPTETPDMSSNWGLIGTYTPDYKYENSEHEYVEYEGVLLRPSMNVNKDDIEENYNIIEDDPRNANIKKHLLRLAVYELHKLISPNNISSARITDYETSITWLRDASRMKLNPQIPRKIDEENKPVTEFAIATFQRDYDPNKNPWQI